MQRRDLLKRLFAGAASLLGLGAVKAAQSVPAKEPLRVVEASGVCKTWTVNVDGLTEKRFGGWVRLNRMLEPGEVLTSNMLPVPSSMVGFVRVESNISTMLFEPKVHWSMRYVETKDHDAGAMIINQIRGQV